MAQSVQYDEFLQRARDVHGDLYNYSLAQANYSTYKEGKIPIICPEHGVFYQTPYHHVYRKQGCRACAGNETVDFNEFLKRAESVHGDDYEYTEAAEHYTSFKGEKIPILCPLQHVTNVFIDLTPKSIFFPKRLLSLASGGLERNL